MVYAQYYAVVNAAKRQAYAEIEADYDACTAISSAAVFHRQLGARIEGDEQRALVRRGGQIAGAARKAKAIILAHAEASAWQRTVEEG